MTHRSLARSAAVIVVAAAVSAPACAQSLADRVGSAPAGHVQFTFAARQGVCGNGRNFYSTSPGNFNGSFYSTGDLRAEACEAGPVRVLIDRAGKEVIAIQTFVGPPQPRDGATDLGRVSGQVAADYLLGLASRADGQVGRQALSPALLADSANIISGLTAVARNKALPRDTRASALSGYTRATEGAGTIPSTVSSTLLGIARDEDDNQEVRRSALRGLGRLDHGTGIPSLMDLVKDGQAPWLMKEAMSALASSGDPRAREFIRSAVQRDDLPGEVVAVAIRALGGQYATQQDAALLRSAYPRLRSDATRNAVLQTVAEVGGSENARWLLDRARDESVASDRRRSALAHAVRAGVRLADLIALYDATADPSLKSALVSQFGSNGERSAVDKLLSIARTETNVNVRKSAISQLGRSEDPRVKAALKDLIGAR